MDDKRAMLAHFLGALAYRTQKALRGAPAGFGDFHAGQQVRTPADLVRHMTSVLGYARTHFVGGQYRADPLPDLAAEVERFHMMLADLSDHLERGTPLRDTRPEQLLQGPFADAMTHAGQLAMLRRLAGSPVPPENFIVADIQAGRVGPGQADPVSPDAEWPEAPGSDALDEQFRRAVAAIDAGDVATLQRQLAAHPRLASDRLETPGGWLRSQVGGALDGFFSRPYLLWFVAEDPVRNDRLPATIVDVIRAIVGAARAANVASLKEQLDYTVILVSWSGVAARCGAQIDMLDALIDAGASPDAGPNNALVNGHVAAAAHLAARGAPLTLASALCLDRWDDASRLAHDANAGQRQFAFVLAALNGKAKALRWMIQAGIDVNQPSGDLYSHGTPLHHAVCSGSLDCVKMLVDAGADVDRPDTAWNGTPLGWAEYYVENSDGRRRARYAEIASYLRERNGSTA